MCSIVHCVNSSTPALVCFLSVILTFSILFTSQLKFLLTSDLNLYHKLLCVVVIKSAILPNLIFDSWLRYGFELLSLKIVSTNLLENIEIKYCFLKFVIMAGSMVQNALQCLNFL